MTLTRPRPSPQATFHYPELKPITPIDMDPMTPNAIGPWKTRRLCSQHQEVRPIDDHQLANQNNNEFTGKQVVNDDNPQFLNIELHQTIEQLKQKQSEME